MNDVVSTYTCFYSCRNGVISIDTCFFACFFANLSNECWVRLDRSATLPKALKKVESLSNGWKSNQV